MNLLSVYLSLYLPVGLPSTVSLHVSMYLSSTHPYLPSYRSSVHPSTYLSIPLCSCPSLILLLVSNHLGATKPNAQFSVFIFPDLSSSSLTDHSLLQTRSSLDFQNKTSPGCCPFYGSSPLPFSDGVLPDYCPPFLALPP